MDVISEEFRIHIKIECGITWKDENTEKRINSAIQNGIAEFKSLFGKDINVENYGLVRRLFMAYCKYYYYDQLEDFKNNYSSEIIDARMEYEVNEYEKEKSSEV